MVRGLAPKCRHFSAACVATFPDPEISTVLPSMVSLCCANIFLKKKIAPYPVASVRILEPPYSIPLPVRTPTNWLVMRLYWPNMKPISRPPTPISPAGTSVSAPTCRYNSVMND